MPVPSISRVKTSYLTMVSIAALIIVISVYVFLLIKNQPVRPQHCTESQSNNCIYSFGIWMENSSKNYDSYPIIDKIGKMVEFDGIKFVYTGSGTPDEDGVNCDNVFPRAINSTVGHHQPVIVNYGGFFKINETRHFTATLVNGQTKSLVLCWNGNATPKVIQRSDSGLGGPMFCPQRTTWFDENKTAGIIQDEYCSTSNPYYDNYIAETIK